MPPKKKRNRKKLGARPYKNYTTEMLNLAIEMVGSKKMTSNEASKNFAIPRRTIEKKIKKLHTDKPGPHFRLNYEEEAKFVKVLVAAADYGSPMTQLDLRLVVFEYLQKNNKTELFDNKPPGEWWVRSFLDRHRDELTVRSTQNIKKTRAEKTVGELKNYFLNLEDSVRNVPPSHILNYDETNFSDDPGSEKAIFRRGVKYPERVMNSTKGSISIMFCATADGTVLAPYVVYKSECMWAQWLEDGPDDARYNRTKSGWFDATTFLDWFQNIIVPWAKKLNGPKVVIGDNLSSHINTDVIELCEKNNIRFVLLPPNSTHITQPLDVAFFGPLKKVWRKILKNYKIENPKQVSLNKAHFPPLLKKLIAASDMNNKVNIIAGFRASGIHPFNPQKVYQKIPDYTEEITYGVDMALLNYLKETRKPNPIKRKTNKKLNVPAGRSITLMDMKSKSQLKNRQNEEEIESRVEESRYEENDSLLEVDDNIVVTKNEDEIMVSETEDCEMILVKKSETFMKEKENCRRTKEIQDVELIQDTENNKHFVDLKEKVQSQQEKKSKVKILSNILLVPAKQTNTCVKKDKKQKKTEKRKEMYTDGSEAKRKKFKKYKNRNKRMIDESESSNSECSVKYDEDSDYDPNEEIDNMDTIMEYSEIHNDKRTYKSKTTTEKEDTNLISLEDDTIKINLNVTSVGYLSDDSKDTTDNKDEGGKQTQKERKGKTDGQLSDKTDRNYTKKNQEISQKKNYKKILIETTKSYENQKTPDKINKEKSKYKQELNKTDKVQTLEDFKENKEVSQKHAMMWTTGEKVLTRYYNRNSWKYYIGIITKIDYEKKYYDISYLKISKQKSGLIKFNKPKREDMDKVPEDVIVKSVQMLQISEKPEQFVLMDDEDMLFF